MDLLLIARSESNIRSVNRIIRTIFFPPGSERRHQASDRDPRDAVSVGPETQLPPGSLHYRFPHPLGSSSLEARVFGIHVFPI